MPMKNQKSKDGSSTNMSSSSSSSSYAGTVRIGLPFSIMFAAIATLLLLVSSVPIWVGSGIILTSSTQSALDDAVLLAAELAAVRIGQIFDQLENTVREQCNLFRATGINASNAEELRTRLPVLAVSLAPLPFTSMKIQYADYAHVGAVHAFTDPEESDALRPLISTWSYDGDPDIFAAFVDPTTGLPKTGGFSTGNLLDPMAPGRGSFCSDEELEHLFDHHLPLWKQSEFFEMLGSVVTQYTWPCISAGSVTLPARITTNGLFGPLALRYYLCQLVGDCSDDPHVTLLYVMDTRGYLFSASVQWSYFAPYLDMEDVFYALEEPIEAAGFGEPRVADTADMVLEALRNAEGPDYETDAWSESLEEDEYSATIATQRVAASLVLRNVHINGSEYFVGIKHLVNDFSRADRVFVSVMSARDRNELLHNSKLYHAALFAGGFVAMCLMTLFVVWTVRPIATLTDVLYGTCALFFGKRRLHSLDIALTSSSSIASSSRPPTAQSHSSAASVTETVGSDREWLGVWRTMCLPWIILLQRRRQHQARVADEETATVTVFSSPSTSDIQGTGGGGCDCSDQALKRKLDRGSSSIIREIRMLAHAAEINRAISDVAAKNTSKRYLKYVLADPAHRGLHTKRLPSTTVLMVDIHRFTSICERVVVPQKLTILLESFFSRVGHDIRRYGRPYLISRRGDAMLWLFNSDLGERDRDHARNAIRAAIAIQLVSAPGVNWDISRDWSDCPHEGSITFSVGVSTGDVVAGNIGSVRRCEEEEEEEEENEEEEDDSISMCYDVVGNTVNLAARAASAKLWTPADGDSACCSTISRGWTKVRSADPDIPELTEANTLCVITHSTYKAAFLRMAPREDQDVGVIHDTDDDFFIQDSSWLPKGVRCVCCKPLIMRNVMEPEHVWAIVSTSTTPDAATTKFLSGRDLTQLEDLNVS